jgi:MerR family transcriptional regulator, copper efflux regulator
MAPPMSLMTIGQLARRVALRPSAIRYYEAHGVLSTPSRSAKEYRLYGVDTVALLRFVRRGKELGLSLNEIRQIMAASRSNSPCALSRRLLEQHLAQVEHELRRLQSLRRRLVGILREPPPGSDDGVCPLIEADQKRGDRRPGCSSEPVTGGTSSSRRVKVTPASRPSHTSSASGARCARQTA